MSAVAASAPAGKQRSIGVSMLLFIVTLGFYCWYWAHKTHEATRQETGDGLGGVLGLVIWILIGRGKRVRDPVRGRKDVRANREDTACQRLDRSLARAIRDLPHPGNRLVRKGARRAQHILGGQRLEVPRRARLAGASKPLKSVLPSSMLTVELGSAR
jgi:hypothetical protein